MCKNGDGRAIDGPSESPSSVQSTTSDSSQLAITPAPGVVTFSSGLHGHPYSYAHRYPHVNII